MYLSYNEAYEKYYQIEEEKKKIMRKKEEEKKDLEMKITIEKYKKSQEYLDSQKKRDELLKYGYIELTNSSYGLREFVKILYPDDSDRRITKKLQYARKYNTYQNNEYFKVREGYKKTYQIYEVTINEDKADFEYKNYVYNKYSDGKYYLRKYILINPQKVRSIFEKINEKNIRKNIRKNILKYLKRDKRLNKDIISVILKFL